MTHRETTGDGLAPQLGLFDTTLLVMGGIVGAGIFFTPARVASLEPSSGGVLLTWAIGGALALSGAATFAGLAALLPRTGGQYACLHAAFGRRLSFVYGFNLLTVVASGSAALVAGVCVWHLETVLRGLGWSESMGSHEKAVAGSLLIAGFAALNARGVRLGARFHTVIMVAKVAGIVAVTGLAFVANPLPESRATVDGNAMAGFSLGNLAPAVLTALFAYGGWQNAFAIAGEVRDAARRLPIALVLGTSAVVALYLCLNGSLLAVLGPEALGRSQTAVAEAARRALDPYGAEWARAGEVVVAGIVVVSTIGITHGLTLMTPRVYYAMARDGLLFAPLGVPHPLYKTPHRAILLQSALAIGYFLLSTYEIFGLDLDAILRSVTFVDWTFFALVAAAYFVLRRKAQARGETPRSVFHPWAPIVFLTLSLGVVVAAALNVEPRMLLVPASMIAMGVALSFCFHRPLPQAEP